MSRQSLFKARSFYVMTQYFYVATEFGLGQGSYVVTKCFYATTEFGQDQDFLCCYKIFLCHGKVSQG